jgi:hypothetical protein
MSEHFTNTIIELNNYPKDKYNVLIPVTSMQVMSNMQRIVVNEVRLDTAVDQNGNGRDIYKEKSSGKYAITKVGGMKLAAAANISIVSSESIQPDVCLKCIEMTRATGKAQPCGSCPHAYDVKYTVTVRVPEPSGGFRLIAKDKEIDCTMEKAGMTEAQYKRFLPHRASIAESKALMRSIRDALGLAATYTLEELKKPFIIAHVVPNLDAPEIRERLASSYLQSMGLLFEQPTGQKALPTNANPLPQKPAALPAAEPNDGYGESDYPPDEAGGAPLPWDDGPGPDGIWCEDCGIEILETKGRNGKTWTPETIKEYSEKNFGRCLCPACQQSARGGR